MGRAEPGAMGFALPNTFSCLPGNSKLTVKAIPWEAGRLGGLEARKQEAWSLA